MTKTQKSPSPMPERDPIPAFEHAVLALFEGKLSTVGFPGVDRTTLLDAARTTNEAQLLVEAAERELERARRDLGERAAELGKLTKRALSYARVLAEDDPSLAETLEGLAPRAAEAVRAPRKRRTRNDATAMLPELTTEETDELAAE